VNKLPNRIEGKDLGEYGFTKEVPNKLSSDRDGNILRYRTVKHERWNSYRHECNECNTWNKGIYSFGYINMEGIRVHPMLCRKCINYHLKLIRKYIER